MKYSNPQESGEPKFAGKSLGIPAEFSETE
jgi:hypothetical protein